MKRRAKGLLALVLSLVMVFALATNAWGAVRIGDTNMNADSYYIKDSNGYIVEATGTAPTDNYAYYTVDNGADNLTLKNFSAEGHSGSAVYSDGNLTINLIGDNALSANSSAGTAVAVDGDLEIRTEGTGASLTATGESAGISANSVTISGGTVYANADAQGGAAYGYVGINATEDVTITGGTVTATGNEDGISAANLTITGGTVTATGDEDGISAGSVTISDGKVTATGTNSDGIHADNGNIEISGGEVIANGHNGIEVSTSGKITISGGTVTATGNGNNSSGLAAVGSVAISGGNVEAKGNAAGITAVGRTVSITGGTVKATAEDDTRGVGILTGEITIKDATVTVGCKTGLGASEVNISNSTVTIEATTGGTAIDSAALNMGGTYQWKGDNNTTFINSTTTPLDKVTAAATATLYIKPLTASTGGDGGTTNPAPPVIYYPPTPTVTVDSAKTFDAGIGLYIGMSVLAATGSAWVFKGKH